MKNQRKNKGAALITVLVSLMIITLILFEFQYAAMVERKLAYNDLNQTQAYYLAKSGVNFALLRLIIYGRLQKNMAGAGANPMKAMLSNQLEQVWQLSLPAFPPPVGTVAKLDKADKDAAEKSLEQTKITDGEYTHVITSESSKINLNKLIVPPDKRNERPNLYAKPTRIDEYTAQMLFNLLEGFLRESKDPYTEFPDLRPEEQVMDIMDWVNLGDIRFYGGTKDLFYERENPPYKAKQNKFFTIEELRLVKGIDEHLFAKLRPYVTVYSEGSKINLNTAGKTLYRAFSADLTNDDIDRLIKYRDEIGGWPDETTFVNYVANNLGRYNFKTTYSDPNNYPFTVGSEAFLIQSIGKINRSASSIQRVIKVAVALSSGSGGVTVANVTNPTDCAKDNNNAWDYRYNQCRTKPKTDEDCVRYWGGQVQVVGTTKQCNLLNSVGAPALTPIPIVQSTTGGKVPPNALKILSWTEV